MRTYLGVVGEQGGSPYRIEKLPAVADDFEDANGETVLSFAQAQDTALAQRDAALGVHGPLTVAEAITDYIADLRSHRTEEAADDADQRANALIVPELGEIEVADLTTERIEKWRNALARSPARRRGKPGKVPKGEDALRARRATANRTFTILKAALNHAWRRDKVGSNSAWLKVKPFEGVEVARIRYLQITEARRLTNACPPDFRKLVQAALQTGARYGQLATMVASDFNPDVGTVTVKTRKGRGKVKIVNVVLSSEGIDLFNKLTAGIKGGDLIFRQENGDPWEKSEQSRPMAEACARAKISPPLGIHQLRHTWASHAVMNGIPLLVVAKNLGHSDTRMVEKHYGHLAPSYVVDAIRKGAPIFGMAKANSVTQMRARRR